MKLKITTLLLALLLVPAFGFSQVGEVEDDPAEQVEQEQVNDQEQTDTDENQEEDGQEEEADTEEEPEEDEPEMVTTSPAIIDTVLGRRNSDTFTITVKNNTDSGIRFYPLVYDITPDRGRVISGEIEGENSLSSWVEVDRSRRELSAGEEKEISVTISVDRSAEAGRYHGMVVFSVGSTRPDAEEKARELIQPEVLINLEVDARLVERGQVLSFTNQNTLLPPASLELEVENIGNTDITPTGIIAIYDQRGKEVDTLELNEDRESLGEEEIKTFVNEWGEGFGRYKAVLMSEYGRETERELWDVLFFWVIPWQVLVIFGLGAIAFVALIWLVYKM